MRTNPAYFIDRIRVLLTALVIFHHTAIVYGAIGGWYWKEVDPSAPITLSRLLLIQFCTANQAYFMGFFFLLSGYFTPPSYERKGARRYVRERLLRLGIPLLVYGFLLGPATVALAGTAAGEPFWESLWGLLRRGYFQNGPLWFAQALLLFACAYILCYRYRRTAPEETPLPGTVACLLAAVGVGAAAFLLRLRLPVGQDFFGLQLGYFASYVFLFALGCRAWQGRWLERITGKQALPWMAISAVTIPLLPIVMMTAHPPMDQILGGWNLWAAFYAFWEPLVAWGIILGLLWQFRTRMNQPSATMDWLAERAYAAYIVHPPVLVGISLALRSLGAPPLAKFVLTGSLACLGCVLAATLLLRIPEARKVL